MKSAVVKYQLHFIQFQQTPVLLKNSIFRFLQDLNQHILRQAFQGEYNGKSAQKFRNHSKVPQIIHRCLHQNILVFIIFILQICLESNGRLLIQAFFDDLRQFRECPAADKENILRIHRSERNHGILAVGAHRHLYFTAFQKLQHPLLHRFTADVSLIRILLLGYLINLIDKDYPVLCTLHIIICGCQQLGYDTLDVIPDIPCFCQRCGVCDREGHIQKLGKCLHQICLAGACRPYHEHVGFLDLYISWL